MCLKIRRNFKPLKINRNYFVAYKVLKLYGKQLISQFEYYTYKVGQNIAKGYVSQSSSEIHGGAFHVYLNKVDAEKVVTKKIMNYELNYRVVPIRCFLKDVVAYGKNHDDSQGAAVTKISIDKRSYEKAIRPLSKKVS
jgi:hypothetical protein